MGTERASRLRTGCGVPPGRRRQKRGARGTSPSLLGLFHFNVFFVPVYLDTKTQHFATCMKLCLHLFNLEFFFKSMESRMFVLPFFSHHYSDTA